MWRSLVAHLLWEQGVGSSNLPIPTRSSRDFISSMALRRALLHWANEREFRPLTVAPMGLTDAAAEDHHHVERRTATLSTVKVAQCNSAGNCEGAYGNRHG
jgi:hypothetical protein